MILMRIKEELDSKREMIRIYNTHRTQHSTNIRAHTHTQHMHEMEKSYNC